uniref:Uncharacterized protein n=1 Tax=Aegilops tauschii TaxID=37682 RepID=M8BTR0_AEGTA
MELVSYIAMCLSFAFLLPSHVTATAPTGMVERETKQQILASIPPHWEENPVLFLTSPSGKYAAYFMRSQTAPGAGGLGADFCYVEVLDTTAPGAEGRSVWESEFLAGWRCSTGATQCGTHTTESEDNNFLKTLQLVDEGDMRILEKGGELAWKASDKPRAAQHCGMPGSPGLAPAMPPFAGPIGKGSSRLPFGQDEGGIDGNSYGSVGGVAQPELPLAPGGVGGQGQAVESVGETMGFGSQPLVDNSPYDSGAPERPWTGVANLGLSVAIAIAQTLGL